MSIVDVCAVDKDTERPASRDALEKHLSSIYQDINPMEGDNHRSVSYAVGDGTVAVDYFRRQTYVTISGGKNGDLVSQITADSGPFNWYPVD